MREVSVMRPITNDVYNIIFHNKSWAVTDHQMILGCSHLAVIDCLGYAVEFNINNITGNVFFVVYLSLAESASFREYILQMYNE